MIVEVYRGTGARGGGLVRAPMLSDALLVERGRAEMDANAHACDVYTLELVPRPGVRLGQLVEISDPLSGALRRGKVTGIRMSVSAGDRGPDYSQVLTVEVPA